MTPSRTRSSSGSMSTSLVRAGATCMHRLEGNACVPCAALATELCCQTAQVAVAASMTPSLIRYSASSTSTSLVRAGATCMQRLYEGRGHKLSNARVSCSRTCMQGLPHRAWCSRIVRQGSAASSTGCSEDCAHAATPEPSCCTPLPMHAGSPARKALPTMLGECRQADDPRSLMGIQHRVKHSATP